MHSPLSPLAVLLEVKLSRVGIAPRTLSKPCPDHRGLWVPPEQACLSGKAWARAGRGHWIPAKMVLAHFNQPRLPGTPHSRSICQVAPARPLLLIPAIDAGLSLTPGLSSAQSTSCPGLAVLSVLHSPTCSGSPCPSMTSERGPTELRFPGANTDASLLLTAAGAGGLPSNQVELQHPAQS